MQLGLPIPLGVEAYDYGKTSSGGTHGVVLTKPHVVDLILDLAGPVARQDDPYRTRILEPAVGLGAFLLPAVERLLAAIGDGIDFSRLGHAVRAYDIELAHVLMARERLAEVLVASGCGPGLAQDLTERWIVHGDFLLAPPQEPFNFICGNPPYVRIEQLSREIQQVYRSRYRTLFDRADLYVAFIERSLELAATDGVVAFICADRWVLNRYGAPLRDIVTRDFSVRHYVDLHQASPFESEVIAYPSIFVFQRQPVAHTMVSRLSVADQEECGALSRVVTGTGNLETANTTGHRYPLWFSGDDPWILSSPEHLRALRDLEARHQPLEAHGNTKVRIGVATGADKFFIVKADADIERDRLVPLVMREDLDRGRIRWSERFVINTFGDDGTVISIDDYPDLRRYAQAHEDRLRRRHVAKKSPNRWFRTIDRVYPELVARPKLLIPDIAGSNEVVFDKGEYFPHHNLYYVLSDTWDLEVLGGLLSSRVALFFVWSYAVKMRGGYLRFQAQYLRRIRVPDPSTLDRTLGRRIRQAFRERDFPTLDTLALQAYGLGSLPEFEFVDTRR